MALSVLVVVALVAALLVVFGWAILRLRRKPPNPLDGGETGPLVAGARSSSLSPAPWVASLCLHLMAVTLLAVVDWGKRSQPADLEHLEDALARGEHKVIWYTFDSELPPVAPQEEEQESATGSRADFIAPQTIVASDPDPRSDRQMIWTPEPAPEIEYDVPSPNLFVWTAPEMPRIRFEMEPRRQQRPENEVIRSDSAPDIETAADNATDLAAIRPIAPLRYRSEARQPKAPELKPLTAQATPDLAPIPNVDLDISRLQRVGTLRYWAEERKLTAPEKRALAGGLAPQVSGRAALGLNLEQIQPLAPLRFQLEAPVARGPVTAAISPGQMPTLADPLSHSDKEALGTAMATVRTNASLGNVPPASQTSGTGEAPNDGSASNSRRAGDSPPEGADIAGSKLAVVGVSPTKDARGPIPFGRRRGRFSAAPHGASGDTGNPHLPSGWAPVRIPNLFIAGAEGATSASVAALAARTDAGTGGGAWRSERDVFLAGIGDRSLTAPPFDIRPELAQDLEAGFAGRRVHTLSINMPAISSAQGSWIVRFSELAGSERKGELFAPSPQVKVDPKYARSAMEEGVEGEVILSGVIRSDGAVDHIELIKSLDQRLDEAAISALSRWKFHPAVKGGVPVEVDVVVRVPFRLTPLG